MAGRPSAGAPDELLLDDRDVLERELDAEVAARDHDRVGDVAGSRRMSSTRGRVSIFATIGGAVRPSSARRSRRRAASRTNDWRDEVGLELERPRHAARGPSSVSAAGRQPLGRAR